MFTETKEITTATDTKGYSIINAAFRKFTLIELLIITAIIAILASILLSSLGNAREAAWRLDCANNLSHIGKTFTMHIVANNNKMPTYDWMLEEQMRDAYNCPKDYDPKIMNFYDSEGIQITSVEYSYGFNLSSGSLSILQIDNPSNFTTSFDAGDLYGFWVALTDESNSNNGHGNNSDGVDSSNPGNAGFVDSNPDTDDEIRDRVTTEIAANLGGIAPTDTDNWYYQNLYFRHLDTACHLFLDGSVKVEHHPLDLSSLLVDTSTNTGSGSTTGNENGNGNGGNGNGNN